MKIGVFDSGVGGITVLTELRKKFGFADYVYLGDTAHVPYGTKSPSQIEKLSANCAEILKHKAVDALVVACNTASSWALPVIEAVMDPIPVFGVVQPGVDAIIQAYEASIKEGEENSTLLILATRATVQSQAYGKALREYLEKSEKKAAGQSRMSTSVLEQACPLLVPMIEEGWIDHPILHQTIREYVSPYLNQKSSGIALLGCTHYPWIHSAFEKAMPGWKVVNSAQAVVASLERSDLFAPSALQSASKPSDSKKSAEGEVEWLFTDPEAVPGFAKGFLTSNARVS
jgi:glutamate racemase